MGRLIGHNKAGSVVILEAELGDHISGTKHSDTPAGAETQGCQGPTQHDEIQCLVTESIPERRKSEVPYLSHRRRIGHHPHEDTRLPWFRHGQIICL